LNFLYCPYVSIYPTVFFFLGEWDIAKVEEIQTEGDELSANYVELRHKFSSTLYTQ